MNDKIKIGQKLKNLRKMKNITLTKLANDTGMSYSFLSGLENDKHSITITTLQRLSDYFDVDLIYFILDNAEADVYILRNNDNNPTETEDGTMFRVLNPSTSKNLQVSHIYVPPYTPDYRRIHNHKEGEEFIWVMEGTLCLMVGSNIYKLKAGDSIFFNSSAEHAIYTENSHARFFLIVSPPYGKQFEAL